MHCGVSSLEGQGSSSHSLLELVLGSPHPHELANMDLVIARQLDGTMVKEEQTTHCTLHCYPHTLIQMFMSLFCAAIVS